MKKMKKREILFSKYSLILTLLLSANTVNADVTIDGELNDWVITQRVNVPSNMPPYLSDEDAVYAAYSPSANAYVFAIKTNGTKIGENTTFWLNTDNDTGTGFKVWGSYGGAEYFINIYGGDGKPYLYKGDGTYVTGPLDFSYNDDHTAIEIEVDASYLGNPENTVTFIGDINDRIFFPRYYDLGDFSVSKEPPVLPERSDQGKRVAIVYSNSSKEHFYDADLPVHKAYSQLFMTMQYQSMMAGIPFDIISEDDLVDISSLVNYDAIIFPGFAYVPKDKAKKIHDTLYSAIYNYGIGIITAGDWMTNLSDGSIINDDAYANMKQMLGIGRVNGGGPVAIKLTANGTNHPAMSGYDAGETILSYENNHWYNYFSAVSNGDRSQPVTVLATQQISRSQNPGNYDAVLATKTGGRNVHFSSLEFMGDSNLLWSAIQWSVYGDKSPAALKMGRYNNLFVSRNDMDQSQEIDEVRENDGVLLGLLREWKREYDFVGSYYINIGNNPPEQKTDWDYSAPLYRSYTNLGNEIGTHSYTHPHDTNTLSKNEIRIEFDDSMNIISSHLNPTWRDLDIRGGAVPGAPENTEVAEEIMQYLDYLSGGYSGEGAGYPGAFGYLTPRSQKVYLSPNMAFDFTMIEFGVPVWDGETGTYKPQPLTPQEATRYWKDEYKSITKHSSLAIIHWPWHDYGPTTGTASGRYSLDMFTGTIRTAYEDGSEFLTAADLVRRIESFKNSRMEVERSDDTITVSVDSQNVGKFAIEPALEDGEKIESVDNWYAYSDTKVFLDKDGGDFNIRVGSSPDSLTRITALPMRAELLSVEGDGNNLCFTFKGEGSVKVTLAKPLRYYRINGGDIVSQNSRSYRKHKKRRKCHRGRGRVDRNTKNIRLYFRDFGVHTVSIEER